MRLIQFFLFLCLSTSVFGEDNSIEAKIEENVDSVLLETNKRLETFVSITDQARSYHTLGLCYQHKGQTEKAIDAFIKEGDLYAKNRINNVDLIAENKLALSENYYEIGELIAADSILQETYILVPKLKDASLQINVLLQTGWLSRERGRHSEALSYYLEAELLAEKNNNKVLLANTYSKIAVVYHVMHDLETAKKYYDKALNLFKKLKLVAEEGRLYNNYGLLYQAKKQDSKAISYFEKSSKMCLENGNAKGAAIATENLGLICFQSLKNNTVALGYLDYSLAYWRASNDIYGQAQNLVYKVKIYLDEKDYRKVVDSASLALSLGIKSGAKDVEQDALLQLMEGYEGLNKIDLAFHYYRKHVALKDSLAEINNYEQINLMGQKHELQKNHVQDSLNLVIASNANQAEIKAKFEGQRSWTIIMSIAFLALVVLLAIFIKSRRTQMKSALIIADTNVILKTKNEEIIDSINYAKNIQDSILPNQEDIDELFEDNFIYYLPKDIVAGDFYWVNTQIIHDERITFVAVADCTGHGVPGAMVSIVCANALNKTVVEKELYKPSEILESVNEIVRENFGKGTNQVNDGMDICLIAIKRDANGKIELQYAGANNPLWYVRKNAGIIEEIRPTKRPIGHYILESPFENHTLSFDRGDTLYLFTDGYADQFGGPKNKKFNYRALKEMFVTNHKNDLKTQREIYHTNLVNWKNDFDQIDDICVMGIRL